MWPIAREASSSLTARRAMGCPGLRTLSVTLSLFPQTPARPGCRPHLKGLFFLAKSGQISDRYSNGDIANAVEVRGNQAFAAYGLQGLARRAWQMGGLI